jgi:hypothetical protein
MNKSEWIWMPHPGHLIVANKCQFHLATYLPSGYLVSTVGEYWPERSVREIHAEVHDPKWHAENNHLRGYNYDYAYRKRFGFEDIGADRKYETMVFKAKATTAEECLACPYKQESGRDLDFTGYVWRQCQGSIRRPPRHV